MWMNPKSAGLAARFAASLAPSLAAALVLALPAVGAAAETIAVFTKNNTPIFAALRGGANVAGRSLGVQVVNYVPSTPDSVPDQIKMVDDAIKDKPDAIVLVPINFTALAGAVDKINAAQIPLLNVNERLANGKVVAYVGMDDVALARETGRYLLNAIGGKGNVAILDGPPDNLTAQGRAKGFRDVVKEFPDVKLVGAKAANYTRPLGKQVVTEFLRANPQLDGIMAANDPMAIGAVDALKSYSRKAAVVGINASREVMDLIRSGDVIGSGNYDTFAQGCLGVELAVRYLRKEATPAEVMIKPMIVDKTNNAPFDQPYDKRECPTLSGVAAK
jgi:ribose transport system substrate-binding protein